jgi:hypothetical protein
MNPTTRPLLGCATICFIGRRSNLGSTSATISIHYRTNPSPNLHINNAFNGCTVSLDGAFTNYNAYLNGASNGVYQSWDIGPTNLIWQTGPLGSYYQPSNSPLFETGYMTANQLGLEDYTVLTDEVGEGTNEVSIGIHFVAVGTNGQPFVNSQGIPDYIEDALENGLYYAGELPEWTASWDDASGINIGWELQYFGQIGINPYADADGDGLCNLDEFLLGTNPTNSHSISSSHTDSQALFLGYTNDPACYYHISITNSTNANVLLVTMWPTSPGTNYQIYSKAGATNAWIVETNFVGTNTNTTVAVYLNGRTLSLVGGDGEDQDGDGLPSGYEVLATLTDPLLPDTGQTGTPDGYKDPDGDGYVNLEEMYNGTDPHVFNAPPAPTGVSVVINPNGSTTVNWNASPGPVTGYVIYRNTGSGYVAIATNGPTDTSYTDSTLTAGQIASYQIQSLYLNLSSTVGSSFTLPGTNLLCSQYDPVNMAIVNGRSNRLYLVVSAIPPGVTDFLISRSIESYGYDLDVYYPLDFTELETGGNLAPVTTNGTFSIPVTAFTNGMAQISDAEVPPFGAYILSVQPTGANGTYGDAVVCWSPEMGTIDQWDVFLGQTYPLGTVGLIPFMDGTTQMKQNLSFVLSASLDDMIGFETDVDATTWIFGNPGGYVLSSYYDPLTSYVDQFMPFEVNYIFRNCVLNTGSLNSYACPTTGVSWDWENELMLFSSAPQYLFPVYNYVTSSNLAPISPQLTGTNSAWIDDGDFTTYPPARGVYEYESDMYCMTNGAVSYLGLPFAGLLWETSSSPETFGELTPGGCLSLPVPSGCVYTETQAPILRTNGYYFARIGEFTNDTSYFPPLTYYLLPEGDPMPESYEYFSTFSPTNTTPPMIMAVGGQQLIAGFAKDTISNGYTNIYVYLGQYFTNAFVMNNGTNTTNFGGIVSEYGNFFATVPGQIALMTKPDPTQNNIQGQCIIDVIRLSLDVNHDGVMNESFTGPDNTSTNSPFVFWANNDYDRWDYTFLDGWVEDDLETAAQPDCNYTVNGNRCIPCARDLEDYARLWVSGVSNTLSTLPPGSKVTLNWGDVGAPDTNNPVIDIFQAADTNGGIGYLTNLATASTQTNTNYCRYVGRLGPGQSIQLNTSTYSHGWAGDHYIWCGVLSGSGQLFVTIADANSNTLAQSSQFIKIQDIKQMYERWTVGDNNVTNSLIDVNPWTNADLAVDNFTPGYPRVPFQYSSGPAIGSNGTYVLYVHGWNMPSWEKDRWAETAYKRLYWQGYQGRFGSFRWPTGDGFSGLISVLTDANNYNNSEWIAWKSGQPLETLLAGWLNKNYPGHVYVLAHSMGNVVTGEALRLAGTNIIVNTYVASQAAISARAYDNTVPADATNSYTPHVYGPDDEGHYYTNGAPPYFNGITGASHFADFYNQEDFALHYWVIDQDFKANSLNYHYTTPTTQFPSGFYYEPPFNLPRALTFPTNTYETFAQAVQSYSFALGAETNIASTFSIRTPINLDVPPYDFGSHHVGHSLEFRSDNMTVEPYWNQLLVSFSLKP